MQKSLSQRVIFYIALTTIGFFVSGHKADAQNIELPLGTYFWFTDVPDEWKNLGYNGNNTCTATGDVLFEIPLQAGGTIQHLGMYLADTVPGSANGEFNFYFSATTTAAGAAYPGCSSGCATSTYINTSELTALAYDTDPNSPNRSSTQTGTFKTIDLSGIDLTASSGDVLWLQSHITCDGISGTLANQRLWFLGMVMTGATTTSPIDGELTNYAYYGDAYGLSSVTLPNVSSYNITSTSTASASFSCDQFGSIAEGFCNVMVWLFAPSNESVNFFTANKNALLSKVPFGYFSSVTNALTNIATTSSTTGDLTIDVPTAGTTTTVKIIDFAALSSLGGGFADTLEIIKNTFRIFLGAAILFFLWERITGDKLE